jgi:hypothetical protein
MVLLVNSGLELDTFNTSLNCLIVVYFICSLAVRITMNFMLIAKKLIRKFNSLRMYNVSRVSIRLEADVASNKSVLFLPVLLLF